MASGEARSWLKVKEYAYAVMLTAGVVATEQYLQTPLEERTIRPEDDPQFLRAQAHLAEASYRLDQAVIDAA